MELFKIQKATNWIFFVLKTVLNIIQSITWRYYGIVEQLRKNPYDRSAHVCKIWMRNKSESDLEHSNKNNFIYFHKEFSNPCIVLNDNISLYSLNEKEAIFVDCGNVDIFNSKHDSFVYNTQYRYAINLIIMPIASFKQISKEVLLPKIPMVHVANHGRCGSTLLFKLFEVIPNALAISEPNAFTDLAELSRKGRIDRAELKSLCYSSLIMTIKHAKTRDSELLFLKCQNIAVYITDVMMDVLPSIKQIYMYRNPVQFVRSYEKLAITNGWKGLSVKELKLWCGMGHNEILHNYPVYPFHFLQKLSKFSKFSLIWITGLAAFNELVNKGYSIKSLKYEDLLTDPKHTLRLLMNFMEYNLTVFPDVDAVMNVDSQKGTKFTSRHIEKKKLEESFTEINNHLKVELNELCCDFNVQLFWETTVLVNKLE